MGREAKPVCVVVLIYLLSPLSRPCKDSPWLCKDYKDCIWSTAALFNPKGEGGDSVNGYKGTKRLSIAELPPIRDVYRGGNLLKKTRKHTFDQESDQEKEKKKNDNGQEKKRNMLQAKKVRLL